MGLLLHPVSKLMFSDNRLIERFRDSSFFPVFLHKKLQTQTVDYFLRTATNNALNELTDIKLLRFFQMEQDQSSY